MLVGVARPEDGISDTNVRVASADLLKQLLAGKHWKRVGYFRREVQHQRHLHLHGNAINHKRLELVAKRLSFSRNLRRPGWLELCFAASRT